MRLSTLDAGERFSPLYFLSSLGAGGLSVSFFMYLMWMTPRPGQPIPSFSSLVTAFQGGGVAMQAMILAALAGILYFGWLHLRLLVWNIGRYRAWRQTEAYRAFVKTNAQSQLMALPLALAMSVNVLFIAGAVFVPGLWEVAEYLFPFAILAFAAIGAYAMRIFLDFMGRILVEGGFNSAKNNSLGQMLSVFAFGMIGVGFSASAAMTGNAATATVAFIGSAFFIVAALIFGAIMMVLGFRSMIDHGADRETAPTLWIVIPFVTVVGIAIYRLNMMLDHGFGVDWAAGSVFAFLGYLLAVQLLFGVFGYAILKRFGYFGHYVAGEGRSPGAFALICPGVAIFVFANFFINQGLVAIGVVDKFSIAYLLLYLPLVAVQLKTIQVYFRLNGKLLHDPAPARPTLVAAE
jgi:hypothetical protein